MNAIERKKLRVLVFFTVASALLGVLIGTLFVAMGETSEWPPRLGAIIGAIIGLGVGVSEEFVVPNAGRTWSYFRLASYRLSLYGGLISGAILAANAILNSVALGVSLSEGARHYLAEDVYLRDSAFAAGAALLAVVGLQLSKLYRPRDIVQLLTGKYYQPEEEDRVVLFVDIVDSSAIVERLGPLRASSFLRDCFADVSEPVLAWRGHVYQHLGDGVVITWRGADSDSTGRAIRCFFDIQGVLTDRSGHYRAEHQAVPQVRAGVDAGKVVATWVGEAKRELALHGDVLHVAARLQSRCREEGATCLVSGECMQRFELPEGLEARDLGVMNLRGREGGVRCYDVRMGSAAGGVHPPIQTGAKG